MPHDDDATRVEPEPQPEPGAAGWMPVDPGGPVVAAAPDPVIESAQQEILAALFGAPTPAAM